MTTHVVQQGEWLSKIARKYGFANWRTIYEHAENEPFRALRPNPDVIFPGDRIAIPHSERKQESCSTGQLHRFEVDRGGDRLRVRLIDASGKPIAGARYECSWPDHRKDGQTGNDGEIDRSLPRGVDRVRLFLPEFNYVWMLDIGHLDPVECPSGVQARLANLGFDAGPIDGREGPVLEAAVRAFQEKHGLVVDGVAGPRTQAKLKDVYGC